MAANRVLASAEGSKDRDDASAELALVTEAANNLDDSWTWNDRRLAVRRIVDRFTEWNLADLPLDFDAIYDCPLGTETLQALYAAVRSVPIVPK